MSTPTEYRLQIYSAAGVLREVLAGGALDGFIELAYTRRVNDYGLLQFALTDDAAAISSLELRSQIEVWRRNVDLGIPWYCDWRGLYLEPEYRFTDQGIFRATCVEPLWLLNTRTVLYWAGTENRNNFTGVAAETIMKTLVEYNAGPGATVGNGRLRTPNTINITVAADTAAGNVVNWACAWDNLLATLQGLAQIGGGDFNLVKIAANSWQFRWYTGQLGTDRSATVTFSLELGNMANPVYRRARIKEATVCIVGGSGEGATRRTAIRTGTDYAAGNDTEKFQQSNTLNATASLNAEGDRVLREMQAEHQLTFDVVQAGAKIYGLDYFLGDKVTAYYHVNVTRKILSVSVGVQNSGEVGREDVKIELGAV